MAWGGVRAGWRLGVRAVMGEELQVVEDAVVNDMEKMMCKRWIRYKLWLLLSVTKSPGQQKCKDIIRVSFVRGISTGIFVGAALPTP